MISVEKFKILTPLQKLPKNVEDSGKLIVAKGLKKLPKVKKSPNLVTLNVGTRKLKVAACSIADYDEKCFNINHVHCAMSVLIST